VACGSGPCQHLSLSLFLISSPRVGMASKKERERASLKGLGDGKEVTGLWLMRHGERVDEVKEVRDRIRKGESFTVQGWDPCGERWWDPPLTKKGVKLAREEAKRLKCLNFTKIYVSPLMRTLETAEQVAEVLGIGVEIVPGLSACAAIVQRIGLKHFLTPNKRNKHQPLLNLEKARKLFPKINFLGESGGAEGFVQACQRLADIHRGGDVLIVSHREGVLRLHGEAGLALRRKPPYCSLTGYTLQKRKPTTSSKGTNPEAKFLGKSEVVVKLCVRTSVSEST